MSYSANYSGATAKNLNSNFKVVKKKKNVSVTNIITYIFFIALAVICFVPFYIMIMNSTQTNDMVAQQLCLWPGTAFFDNYGRMIKLVPIWSGFKNSLIVAVFATLLAAYFGAMTAFGFAKYKFKGKEPLFAVVLMSLIIPPQIALVGFFDVCNKLHLRDNLLALIIPAIASATIVFFVRYYIQQTVPDSVMESARIDGCGEFKIFNRIVIPMIIPSIATMSIFTFITSWNSYLLPLLILGSESKYTMPLWTALSKGTYQNDYGAVNVCIALSMLPIMIVFLFCSKYIIGGLTAGAVKE
jgi:multiple sugar transport system permease protein